MARKGNQQKNGIDSHASNHKKRSSDIGSAEPDVKANGNASEAKEFPGDELPDGSHPNSPLGRSTGKTHNAGGEHKSKKKTNKHLRKDKQAVNGVDVVEQPKEKPLRNDSDDHNGNSEGPSVVEENVPVPPRANHMKRHRKSRTSYSLSGLRIQNALENMELPDNVVVRKLKALALSTIKATNEWLERQRPLFVRLKNQAQKANDYGKTKIMQAYPVVLKWLMHFGSIMLLILMVWLDCAIRGMDSFLRLGTTSFFSVIWCGIFSLIAMVGIFKFLLVLALAALIGLFVGFTLGILVAAISGAIFLWLYGSFWTTVFVIVLGGLAFALSRERVALFISTVYSVYCAWTYVGWFGVLVAFNLAFVSSDILIYFLKNNINQNRSAEGSTEQTPGMQGQQGFFNSDQTHSSAFETGPGFSADRSPGAPSTSGTDSETTSEDEVVRLLNCTDLYSVLGLARYENVDVSFLKREYRKKAMLVHPDKNMGNEKAVEAFKKLQNAYEVLLDAVKRKTYDDELRREELLDIFRRFQSTSQKNGGHGLFASGMARSDADGEDPFGESRRIACKKCNNFHLWVLTRKSKSQARWCQDCNDFHQARDGDGWVEQSSQPLIFGLLQKVDAPVAFVCADSKVYNATEWYICQGMRCPANTHKPSFHVNTSLTTKHSVGKGSSSGQKGGKMPANNVEDCMTEEEFFEWFQNAVQSGMFENMNGVNSPNTESPSSKADEATGPFPESVLFKEKKVEKDGKLVPEFADAEEENIYEVLKLQLENDLQEEQRLRHYEVVYLIHEKHAEEVESVNAKVNDFLREKRGTIWRISDWGMRRLAYKIQKAKNAHYILMNFEMDAKWINDFKSMLDKDERVIRHLVIKRDEAITEDCPPPPEFHSMRSGMDDDDDEDLEIDDEEYDEDWDAEGEFEDDDGIIVVSDEDEEDRTSKSDAKSKTSKLKAEKVAR
uniref:J domain-containing protein n=1 Tax=Cannabis sativa TaxID=3483 RepID=A0A803Q4P1_CANSA